MLFGVLFAGDYVMSQIDGNSSIGERREEGRDAKCMDQKRLPKGDKATSGESNV